MQARIGAFVVNLFYFPSLGLFTHCHPLSFIKPNKCLCLTLGSSTTLGADREGDAPSILHEDRGQSDSPTLERKPAQTTSLNLILLLIADVAQSEGQHALT